MTGNDTGLLVVTSGVSSKLEDFSSQVLEDGGQVDRGTWKIIIRTRINKLLASKPYQHQHAERSCPCEADGEHGQLGRPNQPSKNDYHLVSRDSKAPTAKVGVVKIQTYDWAFLLPLALPPDLPPVIVIDF